MGKYVEYVSLEALSEQDATNIKAMIQAVRDIVSRYNLFLSDDIGILRHSDTKGDITISFTIFSKSLSTPSEEDPGLRMSIYYHLYLWAVTGASMYTEDPSGYIDMSAYHCMNECMIECEDTIHKLICTWLYDYIHLS